jgi:hypothetical protein
MPYDTQELLFELIDPIRNGFLLESRMMQEFSLPLSDEEFYSYLSWFVFVSFVPLVHDSINGSVRYFSTPLSSWLALAVTL